MTDTATQLAHACQVTGNWHRLVTALGGTRSPSEPVGDPSAAGGV